ncbi:hypothetical protein I317_01581 [Kwoniella heveanensis CBS 569]|nr:hypothetical protein I317_01581 [Kwoniella heveanensis CBS 569]
MSSSRIEARKARRDEKAAASDPSQLRQILRPAAGVTDDSLPYSGKKAFRGVYKRLGEFYNWMKGNGELGLFPGSPKNVDELIAPSAPRMSEKCLRAFIRFIAIMANPRSLRDTSVCVDSIVTWWVRVRSFLRIRQGKGLRVVDPVTSSSVIQFIKTKLQKELGLKDSAENRKLWLTYDDLRHLSQSVFDHTIRTAGVLTRWNLITFIAIAVNELLRIGSTVQSARAFLDQTNLDWPGLRLQVYPPDPSKDSRTNRLVIVGVSPNGKTKASHHCPLVFEQGDNGLFADPVFLLLVLAQHSGVFPANITFQQLLDPALFNDGRKEEFREFRFNCSNPVNGQHGRPVFLSESLSARKDQTVPADAAHFSYLIREFSIRAGFWPPVHAHVLRRSGAIAMKRAGISPEEISKNLRHKMGSKVYESYVGSVITADATQALYGGESTVNELNEVHPDRVRRGFTMLPTRERNELLRGPSMGILIDALHALRQAALTEHKVGYLAQLPDEIAREIQCKYTEIRAEWRRECMVRRVEMVEASRGASEGVTVDEYENVSIEPLDAFPSGDDVDFEAYTAQDFLLSTDLSDHAANLRIALEEGEITEEQYGELIAEVDVDEDEVDGDELDDEGELDIGQVLEDNGFSDGRSHFQPITALPLPDTANPEPGFEAYDDPMTSSSDGASDAEADTNPFQPIIRALFDNSVNPVEAFRTCTSFSTSDSAFYGYRPGHSPVDGVCPFCMKRLEDVAEAPATINGGTIREAYNQHVHSCAAETFTREDASDLLALYPSMVAKDPLTAKRPWIKKGSLASDGLSVIRLAERHKTVFRLAKTRNDPFPTCKTCPHQPELESRDKARAHFLTDHGLNFPVPRGRSTLCIPDAIALRWNRENAQFLPAAYFCIDNKYHTDPADIERTASNELDRRIFDASASCQGYGLRTDNVVIPPQILKEDRNGLPSDHKYQAAYGPCSLIVSEEICILCASNPFLSATTVFFGRNPGTVVDLRYYRSHRTSCVRECLAEMMCHSIALEFGRPDTRYDNICMGVNGTYRCPDPVCSQNNRSFVAKLEWLQHLVAVHHFLFRGLDPRIGTRRPTLAELTFDDEDALEVWVMERYKGLRAAKAVNEGESLLGWSKRAIGNFPTNSKRWFIGIFDDMARMEREQVSAEDAVYFEALWQDQRGSYEDEEEDADENWGGVLDGWPE